MSSFRQKLRERFGLKDEIEEEGAGSSGGGASGSSGGATGSSSSGSSDSSGQNGESSGESGSDSDSSDSDTGDHDREYRPFGIGAYWKGPVGKCPKGTKRQPDGTCKKV